MKNLIISILTAFCLLIPAAALASNISFNLATAEKYSNQFNRGEINTNARYAAVMEFTISGIGRISMMAQQYQSKPMPIEEKKEFDKIYSYCNVFTEKLIKLERSGKKSKSAEKFNAANQETLFLLRQLWYDFYNLVDGTPLAMDHDPADVNNTKAEPQPQKTQPQPQKETRKDPAPAPERTEPAKSTPTPTTTPAPTAVPKIIGTVYLSHEVTTQPFFPGGDDALKTWVEQQIKYPKEAIEQGIKGRVIVVFTVTPEGYALEPTIVKSIHPLLDQEAINLVSRMPQWQPATKDGVAVNCNYVLTVPFRLPK